MVVSEPTMARIVLALIAASAAGVCVGIVVGCAALHAFPTFCIALAVTLATMWVYHLPGRVVGGTVDAALLVREAA